ncbi:MAG: hypothetical protein K2N81_07775 [Acetatifactor sp.]|nr:hypothetical protein [Acetatifactor sp.]
MQFGTREELYNYLNTFDFNSKKDTELASVYFLMEFDNHVEPVYFLHFEDSWFESPCELHRFPLKDDEVIEYVKEMYQTDSLSKAYEYEKILQKDGWHYDIDVPQCSPFLPNEVKIIKVLSEKECLDWLLKHAKW